MFIFVFDFFAIFLKIVVIIHVNKSHLAHAQRSDKFIASFLINISTQKNTQMLLSKKFLFYPIYDLRPPYYSGVLFLKQEIKSTCDWEMSTKISIRIID